MVFIYGVIWVKPYDYSDIKVEETIGFVFCVEQDE